MLFYLIYLPANITIPFFLRYYESVICSSSKLNFNILTIKTAREIYYINFPKIIKIALINYLLN